MLQALINQTAKNMDCQFSRISKLNCSAPLDKQRSRPSWPRSLPHSKQRGARTCSWIKMLWGLHQLTTLLLTNIRTKTRFGSAWYSWSSLNCPHKNSQNALIGGILHSPPDHQECAAKGLSFSPNLLSYGCTANRLRLGRTSSNCRAEINFTFAWGVP